MLQAVLKLAILGYLTGGIEQFPSNQSSGVDQTVTPPSESSTGADQTIQAEVSLVQNRL